MKKIFGGNKRIGMLGYDISHFTIIPGLQTQETTMIDVKYIRLTSGEDCFAEVKEENGNIILINPITFHSTEQGLRPIGFPPMGKNVKEMPIKNEHVVYIVPAPDKVSEVYNQLFGSGLVVPNNGIVTP